MNNYETGIESIDNHHDELFQLTTWLDTAIQTNQETELNKIISFLEHYVVDHFKEEEEIMQKADYLGYSYHKSEHESFKILVHNLRDNYNKKTSRTHIIFNTRKYATGSRHSDSRTFQ